MPASSTWTLPDDWRRVPDAQALFEQGARLESEARQIVAEAARATARLNVEARALFDASARAGSVDGLLALARLVAADGSSFRWAQNLLAEAGRRADELGDASAVAVAVDVLGPGLSLDGPHAEHDHSPVFSVISPYPDRAAATLDRVSDELLRIDEHGQLHSPQDMDDLDRGEAYTPNYITPVAAGDLGAQVALDTKGVMWSAMGRTMVKRIVKALAEDRVPAIVAGDMPTFSQYLRPWQRPTTDAS